MYFNRFDIVEAWYLALSDWHSGQYSWEYARLSRILEYFTPRPMLSIDSLSDNGRVIYENACDSIMARNK